MTIEQINDLRNTFRVAMLDLDVPVYVEFNDECADVSFELWGSDLSGSFQLDQNNEWGTLDDFPHTIDGGVAVWQWIAMQFHKMIP